MSGVGTFTKIATSIWDDLLEISAEDAANAKGQDTDSYKYQEQILSQYERNLQNQIEADKKKEKYFQIATIAGLGIIAYMSLKGG